jgi:hypothetical protein
VVRITRGRGGRLTACTLQPDGQWRRADDYEDATLLDPGHLIELALARAVNTGLGVLATDSPLASADRGYAEKRLRADLYPEARSARTARALRTALAEHVADRELLRAACLIFGRKVRLSDYNDLVRAGARVLARVTRETPNLAPALAEPVRRLARKGAGRASLGLMGEVRGELMRPGYLRPRDWKWLSHQANSTVRALLDPLAADDGNARHAWAVRLFAAAQIAGPPAVMVGLVAPGGALARALEVVREAGDAERFADLARLLRLATAEWRRRAAQGQSLRFMRDDLAYLVDWWTDQARENAALIPANAGWASLVRRQQRWHQLIILRNPEYLQQWPSAVAAHESTGYRAIPLTDSLMLAREGMEMRHCVASYARDCAAGNTRIFALESGTSGERATVELRRRAAQWFAGQVKGPCNAEVSPALRLAALRLAARYARADAPR